MTQLQPEDKLEKLLKRLAAIFGVLIAVVSFFTSLSGQFHITVSIIFGMIIPAGAVVSIYQAIKRIRAVQKRSQRGRNNILGTAWIGIAGYITVAVILAGSEVVFLASVEPQNEYLKQTIFGTRTPSPTWTPSWTPTVTPSSTATPTATQTPTSTSTPTPTASLSPTPDSFVRTADTLDACGLLGAVERTDVQDFQFQRQFGVTIYNRDQTAIDVPSNTVRAINIDPLGRVWFGYRTGDPEHNGGLGHFNRGFWDLCEQANISVGNASNAIAFQTEFINASNGEWGGYIWVATDGHGVQRFDGRDWTIYCHTCAGRTPLVSDFSSDNAYTILVDELGDVYVGTLNGVMKYDGTSWVLVYGISQPGTLINDRVHAILFRPGGDRWFGYISDYSNSGGRNISGGVSVLHEDSWNHFSVTSTPYALASNNVRDIIEDSSGNVWIATDGGGVSRFSYTETADPSNQWQIFRQGIAGFPSDSVTDLAVDRFGRVWAGTADGLTYYDGNQWREYFSGDNVYSVSFGPDYEESSCPAQRAGYNSQHVFFGTEHTGLIHGRIPDTRDVVAFNVVSSTQTLTANQEYTIEGQVRVFAGYKLRPECGDMIINVVYNDVGQIIATNRIPISEAVEGGVSFSFNEVFIAPSNSGIYRSIWRVWQAGRYVGDERVIEITVNT